MGICSFGRTLCTAASLGPGNLRAAGLSRHSTARPRPHPQHRGVGWAPGSTDGCCTLQRLRCPTTGPGEPPQPQGLQLDWGEGWLIAHALVFLAFAPLAQKLLCDSGPCKPPQQQNPRGYSQEQGPAELTRAGQHSPRLDFALLQNYLVSYSCRNVKSRVERSCRQGFQQRFVPAPCPADNVDVPWKVQTGQGSAPNQTVFSLNNHHTRASCIAILRWVGISELNAR